MPIISFMSVAAAHLVARWQDTEDEGARVTRRTRMVARCQQKSADLCPLKWSGGGARQAGERIAGRGGRRRQLTSTSPRPLDRSSRRPSSRRVVSPD